MNPALRFVTNQHWAIVPTVFDALLRIVESHAEGIRATPEQIAKAQGMRSFAGFDMGNESAGEPVMQIKADTAVIPVRGVIARYSDQVNGMCQDQGRSAESLQSDIARAVANASVGRIVLRIDSPGGTVAGTAETAAAIRAASEAGKQVVAYIDGQAASAAYWLASQADEVVASSDTALAGSIGVITALVDATKAQEKQGYKVTVVRSVALKAPGTANEALTPEQSASVQKLISDTHAQFAAAVARGRSMSAAQIERAATGEQFAAGEAISLGLVDRVASWESVLADTNRAKSAKAGAGGAIATAGIDTKNNGGKDSAIATKDDHMSKSLEQAAAIAEKHPQHAGLILSMAAKDADEAAILGAIKAKEDEAAALAREAADKAKDAAIAELSAALESEKKAAADLAAKLTAAEKDLEALRAHKKAGDTGAKIHADGDGIKRLSVAEFANLSPEQRAAHVKAGTAPAY